MKKFTGIFSFLLLIFILNTAFLGCYNFRDISIPPEVKTLRVQFIENRAPYVNPQLSPNLTDRLKQKINNQTRLTQLNSERVDWDISGEITDYSVSTSGITSNNGQSQTSINRLTVSVRVTRLDNIKGETKEYNVSRQFDFGANQSLQTAESQLLDEMIRNLTDEIFNKLFSEW